LEVDVADDGAAYVDDFVEQAVDRCLHASKYHVYLKPTKIKLIEDNKQIQCCASSKRMKQSKPSGNLYGTK